MEYYNSQCLLHNLVRENNLLKSQINKLNDIIVNNKSSTSENITNILSKDEVTQLIQNTDPKEHTHEAKDITDLNTTNFATKDELNGYALSSHTHMSSDITDIQFEYTTDEMYYHVEPPFKLIGNELTIDSQYINGSWSIMFNVYIQVQAASEIIKTSDTLCLTQGETSESSNVSLRWQDGMPYISLLNKQIIRMSLKTALEMHGFQKDGTEIGYCKLVISRGPTDMSSERLITANAVREYVESKNSNEKRIISVRTGYDTYYIILCKAEQGNFYTGCLNAGYYKNILINVFYSNEDLSGMGYIIGESLMYSNLASYKAYLVQYEDVKYIALKVTWSGSEHNYTLGTSNCSDISIVKFVSEGVTEVEDLSSTISHHAFQN